jgi:hypothetical protein
MRVAPTRLGGSTEEVCYRIALMGRPTHTVYECAGAKGVLTSVVDNCRRCVLQRLRTGPNVIARISGAGTRVPSTRTAISARPAAEPKLLSPQSRS